ncbi:ABC transporter ATP-binding protein [Treponema sp. OMZ 787]|uniref:ABC transporter ATP-binding protein n=1 Tax=Treponema sp. OMZ 787 TaxID=2563669 RepID=UPI0020A57AC0|nr:ABC transporter ATP-binding protein [Treponema sp. OMZ 787]UTC63104.1 ABC transporter ATP-binding protein [Treponema sp. OMZ 787]
MNRLKRFFRMFSYFEKVERGSMWSNIFFYIIEAVRPLCLLYLSKIIIDAVIAQKPITEVLKSTIILLTVFMLLSIIAGVLEKRFMYHLKCFSKKHTMEKALKVLRLNFELTEQNEFQNELNAIKQFERFIVFSNSDFMRKTGTCVGGFIGAGTALYFFIDLFNSQGFMGLSAAFINWSFLILLIAFNIISFYLSKYIYEKFGAHISGEVKKNSRYLKTYMNLIYDYRTGKDIRLYDKDLAEKYTKTYLAMQKSSHDFMAKFFSRTIGASKLLEGSLLLLIFLFVGLKAIYGSIAVSEVFFYIGAINIFSAQIYEAVDGLTTLVPSDKSRQKLLNFLDIDEKKYSGTLSIKKDAPLIFELKNLSFKYPDQDKYALKNINLKIDANQKLAMVGKNGSGKTTLIKLLVRLYEPTEGEILLNGVNIKDYDYDEYIDIFSIVFQDFKLLSLKLGENVAASSTYDKEKVSDSLSKTGMEDFYKKHGSEAYLYQNFETEGIEASGGEAQKIAMARAIYHGGKIFILDEPTAALDPISEAEIYSHFDTITSKNTAIYISHRLSSCKFCDQIAVMDEGNLIQYGNHDELVSDTRGKYYELWNAQAKHYQEEEPHTL